MFVHGLSGCWANWLEQLPVFAARAPRRRARPAGLRPLADARGARSRSPATRACSTGCWASSGSTRPRSWATRWAASSRAELAIAFPQRVERLVLVSAGGISTPAGPAYAAARACPTLRRAWSACSRRPRRWLGATLGDGRAPAAAARGDAQRWSCATPARLPAPLAAEQLRGAGKPGFMQALEAIIDYDLRERLPEIACPTLIVWGERRPR